jgi:4a-hydroxytetrahydrobiopterin dehydratase
MQNLISIALTWLQREQTRTAERLDHHPIITINWKTVKLSLKSFDVDAITKRDIGLAKEIEKIIKSK